MAEQLWDSDWNDEAALIKAANATPENFRVQDTNNPLASYVPDFEVMIPLIENSRSILKSRGVDWRPKKEVAVVERPIETPEQQLDGILNAAAARMTAPQGRRK